MRTKLSHTLTDAQTTPPRWLHWRWTRTASPADLSKLMNEDHADVA